MEFMIERNGSTSLQLAARPLQLGKLRYLAWGFRPPLEDDA